MKVTVFYQDFNLNSRAIADEHLVVQFGSAILIRTITSKEASEVTSIPDYLIEKEDMAGAVWNIMNNLNVPPGHKDRPLFEKAGHTSMSVGDFIVFEDKEIWVAAPLGWKVLPPNELSDSVKNAIRNACISDKVTQGLIDKIEKDGQTLTPCPYPLYLFYNYMEEVPDGVRVSSVEDCKNCSIKDDCTEPYCLIEEPKK